MAISLTTVAMRSHFVIRHRSLTEARSSNVMRLLRFAQRGIADLKDKLGRLEEARPQPRDYADQRARLQTFIGLLFMYEGRFGEASSWFERAVAENHGLPLELRANIGALRGIAALRRGEIENCVACIGPSSCIFPLSSAAVHERTEGSRDAIRFFLEYLHDRPADKGVRWLLNIAYMTLGEYPQNVPASYLIPPGAFDSKIDAGRFENVGDRVGLGTRGPNLLGGRASPTISQAMAAPTFWSFPATGTKVARSSSTGVMAASMIGASQPDLAIKCCRSTWRRLTTTTTATSMCCASRRLGDPVSTLTPSEQRTRTV